MYKKIKLDREEKKVFTSIAVTILIQILIIYGFLCFWEDRHPVDIKDTEQITITVEKVYIEEGIEIKPGHGTDNLIVVSDLQKFRFQGNFPREGYSIRKLKEIISKGDTLTLVFIRNENRPTGPHTVVAAKTESETIRTLEALNRSQKLVAPLTIIVFFPLESVFLVYVYLCFLGWSERFKSIKKKRRKNAERKRKVKGKTDNTKNTRGRLE